MPSRDVEQYFSCACLKHEKRHAIFGPDKATQDATVTDMQVRQYDYNRYSPKGDMASLFDSYFDLLRWFRLYWSLCFSLYDQGSDSFSLVQANADGILSDFHY